MDAERVAMLRDLLESSPVLERTRDFAHSLRWSTKVEGGLLIVGTPTEDPWHLTAHLDDEARYADIPELSPTLVRWSPPVDAPAHLAIGLERIEHARRGETLFVVAPDAAPEALLERVSDAKKIGATILAMDAGDKELESLAHDALIIPSRSLVTVETRELLSVRSDRDETDVTGMSFDAAQHLVSMAVGESANSSPASKRSMRDRLARFIDDIVGPS